VRLLLSSYLDACEPDRLEMLGKSGKPTSRDLRRRSAVWVEGSYRNLERCLDALRSTPGLRGVYRDTYARWVLGIKLDGKREARAHLGVALIALAMPHTIYVPTDVGQNAGYAPGEADEYARPGKKSKRPGSVLSPG
jgi:hypothetical protein